MGEGRMGRPMNLEGATQRINLGHAQAAIQRCALATLARLKCSSGLLAAALLAAAMIPILLVSPFSVEAYTPHPPILIEGNGDFTGPGAGFGCECVSGGSGDIADPFLIQGWDINASVATGVWIRNTTASFVLDALNVHSGKPGSLGVRFDGVDQGTVKETVITDTGVAMYIQSSSNLSLRDNAISGNHEGIELLSVVRATLSNNSFSDNSGYGIWVGSSLEVLISRSIMVRGGVGMRITGSASVTVVDSYLDDHSNFGILGFGNFSISNTLIRNSGVGTAGLYLQSANGARVIGNTFANNTRGLWVGGSTNVTIADNRVSNAEGLGIELVGSTAVSITNNTFTSDGVNLWSGFLSPVEDFTTHTITPDNLVNGKPIRYYKDCANLVVEGSEVGQLIVANCENVTFSGLRISDADSAVQLAFVKGARLEASEISDNDVFGVHVLRSEDVTLIGNLMMNNLLSARGLATDNFSFSGNTVIGGPDWSTGVAVDPVSPGGANNASVTGNDITASGMGVGVQFNSLTTGVIRANNVSVGLGTGISFPVVSTGVTVFHNNLLGNAIQATDAGSQNSWDDSYPSGGNFWSDYSGIDVFRGPNQDQPGSDGIGDGPYVIDADSLDRFPLMVPHVFVDTTPPAVLVDSPLDGEVFRDAPVTVLGSAFDPGAWASGLDRVEVRLNRGPWQVASGTSNWSLLDNLAAGTNLLEVRAWDNAGNPSPIRSVLVSVQNRVPLANAGVDQTVLKNGLVTLDGSASSDPDADPLGFSWQQVAGPSVILTGADTSTATFIPTRSGAYVFSLSVADGLGESGMDYVLVTVQNQSPVANAGPDQSGFPGTPVSLDGRGSYDPDGDALVLSWTQAGGPPVVLSGANASMATFTPSFVGVYEFGLTVMDGDSGSDADGVLVIVAVNRPPFADAGASQTARKGTLVTLDGSASADPDGNSLTYGWTQLLGPPVSLSAANLATAAFTPNRAGTYLFELTVNDGQGGSDDDLIAVSVWGLAPIADLVVTPPGTQRAGTFLTFDAIGSTDPDGAIVDYTFDFGDGASFHGPPVVVHSYATGTYLATLTVTDDDGNESSVQVSISGAVDAIPTALASAWPGTTGFVGTAFLFDGLNSTDDGTITGYDWDFGDGTTGAGASVVHTFAGRGIYVVRLTVSDDRGATSTSSVTIMIANRAPGIVSSSPAPLDPVLDAGLSVTFAVTASDLDGDALAYEWRVDGVELGSDASFFDFRDQAVGVHRVNVTVTDGDLAASWEWTVTVRVVSGGQGSQFPWWVLLLVLVILGILFVVWIRRRPPPEGSRAEKARRAPGPEKPAATESPQEDDRRP